MYVFIYIFICICMYVYSYIFLCNKVMHNNKIIVLDLHYNKNIMNK